MSYQRIKCTEDFNFTWPSRARTSLKKGFTGPVKEEVAKAAIKAGAAEPVGEKTDKTDKPSGSDSTTNKKSA